MFQLADRLLRSAVPKPGSSVIVVPGNFDGVHRGHRGLIQIARGMCAQGSDTKVLAVTFDPHPLAVIAPERAPVPISTIERRIALLTQAGCDGVRVVFFDERTRNLQAEDFVAEHLMAPDTRLAAVVVGSDFRFGHQRRGDIELLQALGKTHGFQVVPVDKIHDHEDGPVVSSTNIRAAIATGNLQLAESMLDRCHELEGTVVKGQQLARTLGFPTANLAMPTLALPPFGVYAVFVLMPDGSDRHGVMNLGNRPTVEAGFSAEVHVLDWAGDLYGQTLRVGLAFKLRDEQKFSGVDALRAQITLDVAAARTMLQAI